MNNWNESFSMLFELECHIKRCFHVLICVQVVDSALSYSTWHSWHHIASFDGGNKNEYFLSYTAEIICQCIVPLNDINGLKQVLTGFFVSLFMLLFLYPQEAFWQQKSAYKFYLFHQLISWITSLFMSHERGFILTQKLMNFQQALPQVKFS